MNRSTIVNTDLRAITQAKLPWEDFAGKTVLITGANGFLPAYLVETLLYLNEHILTQSVRVVGLVRNKSRAEERFAAYVGNQQLHFITQDVSQPIELTEDINYIIHAASQASPKYYGTDPVGTLSANVLGTMNVLRLAQQQRDLRGVLYFSSSEVYGELQASQLPVPENQFGYLDPTRVRSCYAESKRMGETICVSWVSQFGIPVTIVRPFHTYGPGMALNDGRVYADFVQDILLGRDLVMHSDGLARRAFCYLADATIGFFTVLLLGTAGEAYNVGDPTQEYSISELAYIIASLSPDQPRQVIKFSPPTDSSYLPSPVSRLTPDVSKLMKLNWKPITTVAEGFTRTIVSYL